MALTCISDFLAAVCDDNSIRIFTKDANLRLLAMCIALVGHSSVFCMTFLNAERHFSAGSYHLVYGDTSGALREIVFRREDMQLRPRFLDRDRSGRAAYCMCYHSDRDLLAVGYESNVVRIFLTSSWQILLDIRVGSDVAIYSICFNHTATAMFVGRERPGAANIWRLTHGGNVIHATQGPDIWGTTVNSVDFCTHAQRFWITTDSGYLLKINEETNAIESIHLLNPGTPDRENALGPIRYDVYCVLSCLTWFG